MPKTLIAYQVAEWRDCFGHLQHISLFLLWLYHSRYWWSDLDAESIIHNHHQIYVESMAERGGQGWLENRGLPIFSRVPHHLIIEISLSIPHFLYQKDCFKTNWNAVFTKNLWWTHCPVFISVLNREWGVSVKCTLYVGSFSLCHFAHLTLIFCQG